MAKEVRANAVAVLPPTISIKDGPTRSFLDALSNVLDARSGYTDKDAPERFITAAEFQGMANQAIRQAFGGAGAGAGGAGAGDGKIPSAQDVNDSIDDLAAFIRESLVYQILGEEFSLIDIDTLRQKIDQAQAGISRVEETSTDGDRALASAINRIWASMGGSSAVIEDGALASATPSSAVATRWNQVQAAVTDPNTGNVNSSSILQETRSFADQANNKFNSIYSVRAQVSVDGKTVVGGFGLSATSGAGSGQGPTIDFGVRADKFFIAATSGTPSAATQISQGSSTPFMVLTSTQLVNGKYYPPGVYMKKAVIGEATIGELQVEDAAITNAKIKNAAVDTLKVAGNSVTGMVFADGYSGTMSAGGSLDVAACAISMPSEASGVLISSTLNISGNGGNATIYISVKRGGSVIKLVSVSVFDGFYSTFTFSALDKYPVAGVNTYTLEIRNPTAGPGSSRSVFFADPTIVLTGGKR